MVLSFKTTAAVVERLDALAKARGSNRSQAIRLAILEAAMPPDQWSRAPDRDELLRLLGESARSGSVAAMKVLLEELRRDGNTEDAGAAVSVIDQLAKKKRADRREGQGTTRSAPERPGAPRGLIAVCTGSELRGGA